MWLADEQRPLVLNKTNAGALGAAYGKAFSGWVGKTVVIRKEHVSFGGKQVEARLSGAEAPGSARQA